MPKRTSRKAAGSLKSVHLGITIPGGLHDEAKDLIHACHKAGIKTTLTALVLRGLDLAVRETRRDLGNKATGA